MKSLFLNLKMKTLILCANDFNDSLHFVSKNGLKYKAFKNHGADLDFDRFLVAQTACQVLLVKQQQK